MAKRNQIGLLKNNENRDWSDLEWVKEFYEFLIGNPPDGIKSSKINLSPKKAFSVIWFLQEKFPVLPDQIEQCSTCKELYDSYSQGHHSQLTDKFYCCESCEPRGLYEKEKKAGLE